MVKFDAHRRALERFDQLVDLDHVARCEQVQNDLHAGKPVDHLPCTIGFPTPSDWPQYSFTECWDDVEKNLISGLGYSYCGALLQDDRLCFVRPEYGVVNIPELWAVPSVVSDEGRSMSEGINDIEKLKQLVAAGAPDLECPHTRKLDAWYQFTKEALSQYEKLSQVVHLVLPDTQGPFDLACLVYGSDILTGIYDQPDLVRELLEVVSETYVAFSKRYKKIVGEPLDSAYHIGGLKLVRGGVRICDDSATLTSPAVYRDFIKPYNLRCFAPFDGGWLHFCGNGNHILDEMLDIDCVHYLHLGNPDDHDLIQLVKQTVDKEIVLFWSGSLERIQEAMEIAGHSRLYVMTENRYASDNLEAARENLTRVRAGKPIAKAAY